MENKNLGKSLAVAGNQSTTEDTIKDLLRAGYRVDYAINVGPEKKDVIADYRDISGFSQKREIEHIRPSTYHMKDEETKELFRDVTIDCLISVGWQRLFPEWFLDQLSIGAFGMHGSADPLPRGRGRSPMNWSIIEDRKRFITNLIKYDQGIDSGKIVGSRTFDILQRDTIRSLQHKNQICQTRLLLEHLPDLLRGEEQLTPQPEDEEPTYYPKRVPEDGVIDWRYKTDKIDRLVRAVAAPYPGAFTFDGDTGEKVFIWRGRPFDSRLEFSERSPGEIVRDFSDGTFLVKTGDFTYYVTEWDAEGDWSPDTESEFENRENPSWDKLAQMKA